MATKLVYDRYIAVCALLIPDETVQPFTETGMTSGEIIRYSLGGPVKGDGRPIGRDLE